MALVGGKIQIRTIYHLPSNRFNRLLSGKEKGLAKLIFH